jgi:hypothetical protein
MSLLANIKDKLEYALHSATYDPAAEEYAASRKAAQEAEDSAHKAQQQKEERDVAAKEATEAEKERRQKEAETRKANSQFNAGRFMAKTFSTFLTVFLWLLAFAGAIYGAHLSTNLNLYRSWPYRILYAVYGFIFFPVVILYVLGYRWFWKGKKPRYYAVLPLIPYYINHPILANLFSWLSYKPDDIIDAYQEWNPAMVKKGEEAQAKGIAEEDAEAAKEAAREAAAAAAAEGEPIPPAAKEPA